MFHFHESVLRNWKTFQLCVNKCRFEDTQSLQELTLKIWKRDHIYHSTPHWVTMVELCKCGAQTCNCRSWISLNGDNILWIFRSKSSTTARYLIQSHVAFLPPLPAMVLPYQIPVMIFQVDPSSLYRPLTSRFFGKLCSWFQEASYQHWKRLMQHQTMHSQLTRTGELWAVKWDCSSRKLQVQDWKAEECTPENLPIEVTIQALSKDELPENQRLGSWSKHTHSQGWQKKESQTFFLKKKLFIMRNFSHRPSFNNY